MLEFIWKIKETELSTHRLEEWSSLVTICVYVGWSLELAIMNPFNKQMGENMFDSSDLAAIIPASRGLGPPFLHTQLPLPDPL